MQDVKDALASFKSAAKGELGPEVQAVEDALGKVESEVDAAGSNGIVKSAPAIAASVASLGAAGKTLLDGIEELNCP